MVGFAEEGGGRKTRHFLDVFGSEQMAAFRVETHDDIRQDGDERTLRFLACFQGLLGALAGIDIDRITRPQQWAARRISMRDPAHRMHPVAVATGVLEAVFTIEDMLFTRLQGLLYQRHEIRTVVGVYLPKPAFQRIRRAGFV